MKPTFEYCSLAYFNQWTERDKPYSESLACISQDKKLKVLKEAAGFYKVARNLHTVEKDVTRYQPLLTVLDSINIDSFNNVGNVVKEVERVEQEISERYTSENYPKRDVLSLTTKFLWLKIKSPIVIYDSRARAALNDKRGNLESYYQKWSIQFNLNKNEISNACLKLPTMSRYMLNQSITEKYITEISQQLWFQERVFDVYLWTIGTSN